MKIIPTILLIFIITFITSLSFAQNRVLSLNGEGDYVEIPATSSFALQDFTISFFVNPKAQNEDIVTLIDYNHKEETGNWVIQTLDAMDTNMWAMGYRSGVMNQWQPRFQGYNNAPFTEGVWQHIAFVKQSDKVFTYKNGFLIHTRVDEDPTVKYTTPAPLYFGHWNRGGRFFNGLLDEVRIFNYACTQEEIRKTMHTTLSGTEPGLVGYWRFDDIGKVATDLSKGRSDGKLMGDARFAEAEFPEPGELVIPTVLSGIISDGEGRPIPNTSVRLEKKEEIAQTQTDASGSYWISIFEPVIGVYDLSATKGELGGWQLNFRLREGEHRKLNLMLAKAISIEGTLLMLDDKAPHVAVPVQAIHNGEVIATVLSDENGKYQFINLKPEKYQVRCQVLNGYIYYGSSSISKNMELRENDREESPSLPSSNTITERERLEVKSDTSLSNIDFRFAPFKKGVWKTYNALGGLADNYVYAIYRTSDGVMWFGTSGGASCYDGNQFVNLTVKDGLVNNKVLSIYGDPDGIMWFGTAGGVSRYDGNQFINFTTKDGLGDNVVNAIHRDPDGVMWFGMGNWYSRNGVVFRGGVSRYDGNQFINFTTKNGLANNWVNAIHRDPDGVMWFGKSLGGISRYDGNQFVNFTTKDGLADNWVNAIHRTSDGVMWFGTIGGVSCYDGKQFVNLTVKDGLVNNGVLSIYGAPDGIMWFGTAGGVSRYDGKQFINFTIRDGLGDNVVNAIHRDPDGVMWFGMGSRWASEIGVFRGGVSRYYGNQFINFTTKDGLASNTVTAIHCAPDSVMWFGTSEGVSRYDGNQFVNFTTKDGLLSNDVRSIDSDPDGVMWFGTYRPFGEGESVISRYDGNQFVTLTNGLYVYRAPDGVMWFGLWGGVSRYDGKELVTFTPKDGLVDGRFVTTIYGDSDGVMWFGTGGGVSRYNGKEFKNFTTEDGLAGNIISDIHRDTDSTIWFATEDGGVSRYDGRNFINFTKEDGLASNNVHAICETSDGMMWFGTSGGGVSCYDGTVWTSLDTRDGLAGNSVNSIQQDLEGYLWFGTIDGGITRYRRSTVSPKVRIVSVRTDKLYILDRQTGKSLQAIPTITTNRLVTIKYTALDFKTIPEKQQYRCRIRKIDQDWRRPTKSTYFDYTFNKTGTYVFEVQAIDRDLNYSEPASLTLKIVPPFYLRAGFLIPVVGFGLILIAVLTIVSIGYIKRHRQVQAYQQEAVRELQDANRIQMSLMPNTSPLIAGVEIAGKCLPANTVSGDFFDYLESKQPNEIALVVADVTGKAMKGAMNAVMADGVLRMAAEEMENLSSASLMMKVNNVLTGSMEWGMNITMVIGTIDTDTQNLTLANAAHHAYPLLFRNGEVQVLKTGGLPLGMRARIQYSEEQFQLQSGDVVFFMTDGIIEAQDNEGKMYSDSGRLEETIAQFTLEQNAEAMVEAIINDAIDFGGARESRDDDMTVVVVKIK